GYHAAVIALLVVLMLAGPAWAELKLATVFGDNMVLQRDRPVPVWGWAEPGDNITVTFAGQTKTTRADSLGAWKVTLDSLSASAVPQELVVQSETESRQSAIGNVAIGDIWLCSGDFGVYYEMFACANAAQEAAAAQYPAIRLLKIPGKSSNTPLADIEGEWRVCSPEMITDFSALGYFFGRALHRETGVPIGVIDASYRYSSARGWIPPAGFRMIPELKKPRDRMDSWDPTTPTGHEAFSTAVAQVEQWLPGAEQAFRDGTPIPPQPRLPAPTPATDSNYLSIREYSLHYQGMIHPLIPFAIRGLVWSLGESGCLEGDKFRFYLQGLFLSWRQAWGQGEFPVYLELLPQVGKPPGQPGAIDFWTRMREDQMKCLTMVPNTDMAVTFDVSDYVADGRNRVDAGERLARVALARDYGKNIVYSGPRFHDYRLDGDKVIIFFDHVGSGLMVGEKPGLAPTRELKNGVLQGFAVAGEDKKWHWAEAKIDGGTVIVRSDQVPAPVAVRYAYASNPGNCNLYNREGLPAAPFRTDEW
ncbi:hypothetical protein HQ590_04995, partial [bacterium]|nr:hypothetical protein [bacterium]